VRTTFGAILARAFLALLRTVATLFRPAPGAGQPGSCQALAREPKTLDSLGNPIHFIIFLALIFHLLVLFHLLSSY
jgi:hypothetical protein